MSDAVARPDPGASGTSSGRSGQEPTARDTPGRGDAPHEPHWDEESARVRRDPIGPMGKTSSLLWSLTRDDAPNVRAGSPYLANFVTKIGRFGRIDPRKHGLLWNRWKWLGLVFWAGLLGGAFAKAWKDEGGLRPPDT